MIIQQYGGPEQLVLRELPMPQPAVGNVLVRVRALGINHAETYMRQGAWAQVARVSGIECVGEVVEDTTGRLAQGVQKALPLLNDGASVILTTTAVDTLGLPGSSVYAASKAALRSLARTLSAELIARNVRVNAVAPGPIETPIFGEE